MALTLAREVAYDAFVKVIGHRQKPEDVLAELYSAKEGKLSRLDRNFITEILYGSLRWYSKIYWILQNTSKRDLDKSSPEVVAALVVGTYQIYYLDRVPDRAAVNESVEYVRKRGQASACSFVNGILRQIARRAEYFTKPDKKTQPIEYLALQFAHPHWIVKRWSRLFKFEKLESILSSNNNRPSITARVNAKKIDFVKIYEMQQRLLKEEKVHSDRRPLRSALQLQESPVLGKNSLFSQGYYTIQDEAAQLIGYLAGPQANESLIDACCGPGGKLTHLCELADDSVTITGIERNPVALERTKENLERLEFKDRVELIQTDFLSYTTKKPVDKVLLDAPCSGLGVLRRHPDGKWSKTMDGIGRLAKDQWALIEHGLGQLKVGGELIYSVCSIDRDECEEHLSRLLKKYGEKLEVVSPVSRLPDYYKKYVTRANVLMIYPDNQDGMDGFGAFVVRVRESLRAETDVSSLS